MGCFMDVGENELSLLLCLKFVFVFLQRPPPLFPTFSLAAPHMDAGSECNSIVSSLSGFGHLFYHKKYNVIV